MHQLISTWDEYDKAILIGQDGALVQVSLHVSTISEALHVPMIGNKVIQRLSKEVTDGMFKSKQKEHQTFDQLWDMELGNATQLCMQHFTLAKTFRYNHVGTRFLFTLQRGKARKRRPYDWSSYLMEEIQKFAHKNQQRNQIK